MLDASVTVLDKIHMISVLAKTVVIKKHDKCYDKKKRDIRLLIPQELLNIDYPRHCSRFGGSCQEQSKQNTCPEGLYISGKKFNIFRILWRIGDIFLEELISKLMPEG